MDNWASLDGRYLPVVEAELARIRETPIVKHYEAIVDMIAPIKLSDAERLKLRARLEREFSFPADEFDLVFGSKA